MSKLQEKHWYWVVRRGLEHPIIYAKAAVAGIDQAYWDQKWRRPTPKPNQETEE